MTRRRHRKKRVANQIRQLPWRNIRNNYAPVEILSAGQVETIIETALQVLANQGMRFLEPSSRDLLRRECCNVDDDAQIVRFDPDFVREKVSLAPAEFTLRARNPDHDLVIGGNNVVFASVGGPAFCSDLDKGRRPGSYEEL
ncbi:MAG: trimethylamine methyltransferase family protein, partial [Woeseiaceae bacterium]